MALLTIAAGEQALAERAAERFVAIVGDAVRVRGTAFICLAGGTTPKHFYELLATEMWRVRVEWDHLHVYFGDERHVPPDHRDSNYGMARDALLMHVPIPAAQLHRIRGELAPEEGARLYERDLPDRFDLLLLGIGEDAHIASLFPGSPAITERERRVCAVWASHLKSYRVTLTPRALLSAAKILVLVAGANKARAVANAIEQPDDPMRFPAHVLRPAAARVEWLIDRAAARELSAPRG